MKLDVKLEALPLIAQGGQADICDYGDGKVIRVPRWPRDYDRIRYEYAVYESLKGSGVAAPKVFDLVDIEGKPSIIMERIGGVFILMRVVPRAPNIGFLLHLAQKRLGAIMAGRYLKEMVRARPFDMALFSQWVLIKAAERSLYGLPSEMKRLQSFIGRYLDAMEAGKDDGRLYRLL
jgi:hypothetical protein